MPRMLRLYMVQPCVGLSDEGVEEAVYDSQAIRALVGIDLNRESAPEATTLLQVSPSAAGPRTDAAEIRSDQRASGCQRTAEARRHASLMRPGIAALSVGQEQGRPSGTLKCIPSKKGNDWHFGMKAHIGVDAMSGLVHTVVGTAGNVSDVTQARSAAARR